MGNLDGEMGQQSLLTPQQERLHRGVVKTASEGSFDPAVNYYRGLLSDDNADMEAFTKPEMRRFNEQVVPGLSEQFAGMGAGGLSSSGFRNAAVGAGTDLSERLASIRANIRGQAAQGLMQFGQIALNPTQENYYQQQAPSMMGPILGAAGTAAGAYFGGPGGAAVGGAAGNTLGNYLGQQGRSDNIYGQSTSLVGGR